jgi:hypothetical protein
VQSVLISCNEGLIVFCPTQSDSILQGKICDAVYRALAFGLSTRLHRSCVNLMLARPLKIAGLIFRSCSGASASMAGLDISFRTIILEFACCICDLIRHVSPPDSLFKIGHLDMLSHSTWLVHSQSRVTRVGKDSHRPWRQCTRFYNTICSTSLSTE